MISLGVVKRCLGREVDGAVGISGDALAVSRVHGLQVLLDHIEDIVDTQDQFFVIPLWEVGSSVASVFEDQITREENAGLAGVKTEVVVLMAWCMHRNVLVIAEYNGFFVRNLVVDAVDRCIEAPRVDVECVFDRLEICDVVFVRVREYDGVEFVDSRLDLGDDVEIRTRVDQDGSIAGNQVYVARERVDVFGEVFDHTERT